jgi:hypothetical protein
MQTRLLTFAGLFPWECVLCRGVSFRRDSGRGAELRPSLQAAHDGDPRLA